MDIHKCLYWYTEMPKNCWESNLFSGICGTDFEMHDFFKIDRIKYWNLQLSEGFAAQVCLMRYRNSFATFVVLFPVVQQYEWRLKLKIKLNAIG